VETSGAVEEGDSLVLEARGLFEQVGDERGLATTALYQASLAWLRTNARETVTAMAAFDAHRARGGVIDFSALSHVLRFGPFIWGPFTPEEMRRSVSHLPAAAHPRIVVEAQIAQREGRYDDAIAGTTHVREVLFELGLSVTAPMSALASQLQDAGRLDESLELYELIIARMRELGETSYLSTALIDMADLQYARGEPEEAERLVLEGEALGGPEDLINFSKGHRLRAVISADRGDDAAALAHAQSAVEYALRTDFPHEHGGAYEALAHVHATAGRTAEARAAYESAAEIWTRFGWPAKARRAQQLLVEL
jgi:tetratricopeptide (TPR) repeat protein